ncbi:MULTISPECIES: nucleotide pyrophosphohydrolase [unclassified Enterococcus]|uniref:nucleotide pyrophosphohydrolase n=1 Tax=unclassified Enterococcus TaxID=2608891 RepID=UPI00155190DC|nr:MULTISPECIES: nucleotide pyrophosphohydrolase [unclassified Enterococcus]MBS7577318.1 nucleotide pyrophosphohydrolase [Enterococcus sp. MMGLQ5-2]MBS7584589.1 nucleotide pyrophosphohydrolase [Enterococcus sp. MMGLQ5-1]NPD12444.1 nucleotide pyrophosphohydrolase [Enterococcus sp. MMGLQ5-1]NPD37152.1 nucleotide pyrophosphohydrolase [Enterococcus sp. MMGLQ5-2]
MSDLTVKQMQAKLDHYVSQYKVGYFPPLSQVARLTEELGELAREVMDKYGEKPKKETETAGSVAEELTDLMISLVIFANSLEIDLAKQFEQNMEKFERRDKNRFERMDKSEEL